MKFTPFSSLLTVCFALVACASHQYKIQSTPPEADVELVYKTGTRKPVGKTPLSLSAQEVNPNHEPVQIEIKKEGFEKQSVFVPESYFAKNVDTTVTLQALTVTANAHKDEADLNEVASAVADIQKDIQTKNYGTAMTKLNRLVAQYPQVATFYSLIGNVYYLEKRLDKALTSYKKALSLSPTSVELQRVIEKIEGVSGGVR